MREKLMILIKDVETSLGMILYSDYYLMKDAAEALSPAKVKAEDRGELLNIKTGLVSAFAMLDSLLAFRALVKKTREHKNLTADELSWLYDNTVKATKKLIIALEGVEDEEGGIYI